MKISTKNALWLNDFTKDYNLFSVIVHNSMGFSTCMANRLSEKDAKLWEETQKTIFFHSQKKKINVMKQIAVFQFTNDFQ